MEWAPLKRWQTTESLGIEKNQKYGTCINFLAKNLNQGYIKSQFRPYMIIKFCKFAEIRYSLESGLSRRRLTLKNHISTIRIRCKNFAPTQSIT